MLTTLALNAVAEEKKRLLKEKLNEDKLNAIEEEKE